MTNEELHKLAQEVRSKDQFLYILIELLATMREMGLEKEFALHIKQFTGTLVEIGKDLGFLK